jgi:DDE superfamily endonuclease
VPVQTLERSEVRRQIARDTVAPYVDLPDHASVLSIDEKTQIQASDRTQPSLPIKKGRAGTTTYKRHDTTTLVAALNVLEGKIIGQCRPEFIRSVNAGDANVPANKAVHAIMDNYAAQKHPKIIKRLYRNPRFVFHFAATAASGVNTVEGFFAASTKRRLKCDIFR